MRHPIAMLMLCLPTMAAAAGPDGLGAGRPGAVTPADVALVVGGLLVAALIGRRRRGLPDSCD